MPYWRTHGGVIPPPALALNGRLSMGGLEAMSAKIFLPPLEKILWGGGQIIFRLFRRCKTDPKGVKKSKCTAVTIIYPPYFFSSYAPAPRPDLPFEWGEGLRPPPSPTLTSPPTKLANCAPDCIHSWGEYPHPLAFKPYIP